MIAWLIEYAPILACPAFVEDAMAIARTCAACEPSRKAPLFSAVLIAVLPASLNFSVARMLSTISFALPAAFIRVLPIVTK